jgi:hypothetical protein
MDGISEREQKMLASMPANFHFFGVAGNGKVAEPQALTLHFATPTQITKISSSPDFKVVPGGTCEPDRLYKMSESCNLLVEFTPQGAGHRLGKLTVAHTAGEPASFGLIGQADFPTVSFIPSLITTVPRNRFRWYWPNQRGDQLERRSRGFPLHRGYRQRGDPLYRFQRSHA